MPRPPGDYGGEAGEGEAGEGEAESAGGGAEEEMPVERMAEMHAEVEGGTEAEPKAGTHVEAMEVEAMEVEAMEAEAMEVEAMEVEAHVVGGAEAMVTERGGDAPWHMARERHGDDAWLWSRHPLMRMAHGSRADGVVAGGAIDDDSASLAAICGSGPAKAALAEEVDVRANAHSASELAAAGIAKASRIAPGDEAGAGAAAMGETGDGLCGHATGASTPAEDALSHEGQGGMSWMHHYGVRCHRVLCLGRPRPWCPPLPWS